MFVNFVFEIIYMSCKICFFRFNPFFILMYYIKRVFFGVYEKLSDIDDEISKNAVGWSIKRITKTALAILRLAIYEIKFMDSIPVAVSINEAVELAKKYSTPEDASFINGILSSVEKKG